MDYVRGELSSVLPPLLVGALAILAWSLAAFRHRRHAGVGLERARATVFGDAMLALSILVLLLATLYTDRSQIGPSRVQLDPLRDLIHTLSEGPEASVALRDLALNILLFVPFGFFLAQRIHRRHRFVRTVLAGIALSFLVEVVQLLFLRGRTVDVNDVILNVLGTAIGAAVGWGLRTKN
jgi:glycopeptide antibiotics resistance protein